ncbi:hypothetical protein S7711_03626 [Stachybotrys chartarum IBT 7711]|uniref:Transaldolase n=1 Tax=Stachybotrys chartarum (strain CBS 109288 / IBT 7711) TaxID=1280523 RepID=A0A084AGY2_STACB|nr:hypothetical protein S7711_03626 [Stachybotrys chartarum IBT 7711]KFA50072.1 hypothetical protein S40293_08610 [Stachybotrys chartarum IBT 40293]
MAEHALSQLKAAGTVVIVDTADFKKIAQFEASEGTTNPSLLYAAAQNESYAELVADTISYTKSLPALVPIADRLTAAVDHLAVSFGTQIYKLTGRVSTEVDVSLSFNTPATIASGLRIIELYAKRGVPKEHVRIKISATWEGIQAAKVLQEDHGVSCLVTIVFGLAQAAAAAEAGVDAIAPYVGRIADWGKVHGYQGDHGVETVSAIVNYLRKYGYKTQVMAASFRNAKQVRDLAGIDLLTASPVILEAFQAEQEEIVPILNSESAQISKLDKLSCVTDEALFRWAMNMDACAVEKSAEAMRKFLDDTEKLKSLLASML